jgi:Domain of unknown function (DU1801)
MARLEHPLKEGVQRLRTAILASNDTITEHIKWNAPSFRHAGQDRVTFRLQPGDKLQLIFHRGAKVRTDTAAFAFNDPTGLMTWLAPDLAERSVFMRTQRQAESSVRDLYRVLAHGASSERLRRSIPPHFSARASEQHIDPAANASGRGC